MFELFTDTPTHTGSWNEKASQSLYKMIAEIRNCSQGMGFVPSIPLSMPNAPGAAARYLLKYVYDAVSHQIEMNKKGLKVVIPCLNSGIIKWRDQIIMDLMGL